MQQKHLYFVFKQDVLNVIGKGDVLPFAVGQDVLLLSDPLLGGLHAAGTTGL